MTDKPDAKAKIVGKINLDEAKKRPTKVTPLKVPLGEIATHIPGLIRHDKRKKHGF